MNSDKNNTFPIVVLISASAEWLALRQIMPDVHEKITPYGAWFIGKLDDYEIIFMHGGYGKIAAAGSTQYAIGRWSPELLINLGT